MDKHPEHFGYHIFQEKNKYSSGEREVFLLESIKKIPQ